MLALTLSHEATSSLNESGENARLDIPSAGGCSDVSPNVEDNSSETGYPRA